MAITHGYMTVDELRDVLRDQLTAYDAEYERAIGAASRQIDDYCGRHFWMEATPTVRTFRPREIDLVWTGDIATTTGLVVATDEDYDGVFETTWTIDTDFILEPFERINAKPYERIAAVGTRSFPVSGSSTSYGAYTRAQSRRPTVQVTASWGWATVPQEVIQACSIVAVDHFKAKDLTHVAATYGNDVRIARDVSPGMFGRKLRFSRLRAPLLNPEAEAILSSLRYTVVA